MGFKSKAAVAVICLLLFPVSVKASTASDLYKFYGKELVVEYPKGVTETISKYQAAQRYVKQFRYVADAEYDYSILESRIADSQSNLDYATNQLASGYHLDLETIYGLEDVYCQAVKQLDEAVSANTFYDINYQLPIDTSQNLYSDYSAAVQIKSLVDKRCDIGKLTNLEYPVLSNAYILDSDDTSVTFMQLADSVFTSLFNGKVSSVDETSIVVNHYNGIFTHYSYVKKPIVEVGDIVSQGQPIGYTYTRLTVKLSVDDELQDIARLFKESRSEEIQDLRDELSTESVFFEDP